MIWILSQTILIALGLFGFLLASHIHNKKIGKQKLVCPLRSDCDTVINSDYSKVLGIPVEVLGMFYYAFISISHGLYSLYTPYLTLNSPFFMFFLILFLFVVFVSVCATLFSFYLIFIQAFKIKQWCMWCMGSALISLLICVISIVKNFFL